MLGWLAAQLEPTPTGKCRLNRSVDDDPSKRGLFGIETVV